MTNDDQGSIEKLNKTIQQLKEDLKDANRAREAIEAAHFDIWENNFVTGETHGTNRNLFLSLGYGEDELPKNLRDTFDKVHPDDLKASLDQITDHVNGLTPHYQSEMRIKAKDGRWVWTGNAGQVLERDQEGNVTKIIGLSFNIDHRRMMEENMKTMAYTDELTGLGNRRMLWESGSHEVERSLRYKHPLTMLLLDLDNFKTVNDTLGHITGDQVLRLFAQTLHQVVRQIDLSIRFGGDEFVILLIETDQNEAQAIATRLCDTVASTDFGIDMEITVSIGGAHIQESDDLNKMIQRSDQALYQAKENGRNCAKFI